MIELVRQTLDWPELVAYVVAGIIGGFGVGLIPLLPVANQFRDWPPAGVPFFVILLATPLVLAFWAVSLAVSVFDGDPLAPRLLGRAIGQEVFIVALALGLWIRMRWRS